MSPAGRLTSLAAALSAVLFIALTVISALKLSPQELVPFDSRFFGYGVEEARSYIVALAEAQETGSYLGLFRTLDSIFPFTLAVTVLGALWINTRSLGAVQRLLLLSCPLPYLGADLLENARVAGMLRAGPEVAAPLVEAASRMTQIKWVGVVASLVAILATWRMARLRGGAKA